ncbi:hypothetical protein C7212DRAFT_350807 [Tuber magnatum]|uniref:Nephrocystin 3-like N-terminal domain-containing protein n=1 Tax=Tuber magnatum TaxID=42249 RepID=A0A317SWD3_9PEZI|nr:hypothetical protein C7212DRAFT_350807 [Tuber magnatum]
MLKDYAEEHWHRVREPVEGTCTWVTEYPKYRNWRQKETSGLLWLSADPGCEIRHRDAIVCYFFFKDDSREEKNAKFALCPILHQLFSQRKWLWECAKEAFEATGRTFKEEVDTLWDILVRAVSEGGCGEVICVVDAWAEHEEVTIAPLIRHVIRPPGTRTSNMPLRFFVASRHYHKIKIELESRATTIRLKGEDEVSSITTDVTRDIDNGIKQLELLLHSSADRTFLWVSLILESLRDSPTGSHYDKAQGVLNIVVAATRPPTLTKMNYQAGPQTVKSLCGLFWRIIDSKVYLAHQTAREFLLKESSVGQGNWQYSLCYKASNYVLADICISYLLLEDFENDPFLVCPDDYPSAENLVGYTKKYDWQMELFGFTRLICTDGSKRFLTWLKVYWGESGSCHRFPIVGRLLEKGEDINARSKQYGTVFNVAAIQENKSVTRMLVGSGGSAFLCGKEYKTLHVKGPPSVR